MAPHPHIQFPDNGEYFFPFGEGIRKSCTGHWQCTFRRLSELQECTCTPLGFQRTALRALQSKKRIESKADTLPVAMIPPCPASRPLPGPEGVHRTSPGSYNRVATGASSNRCPTAVFRRIRVTPLMREPFSAPRTVAAFPTRRDRSSVVRPMCYFLAKFKVVGVLHHTTITGSGGVRVALEISTNLFGSPCELSVSRLAPPARVLSEPRMISA